MYGYQITTLDGLTVLAGFYYYGDAIHNARKLNKQFKRRFCRVFDTQSFAEIIY